MANPIDDSKSEKLPESTPQPQPQPQPSAAGDLESQTTAATAPSTGGGGGVSDIVQRWKREDLLKKGSSICRGSGLVLSLLAFVIMASNQHGDWREFDHYEEYRYVLAIAILSTLYTGLQVFREYRRLSSGKEIFPLQKAAMIDFFGDQISAYLLISAASSAVPLTNRMREGADNIFTDQSASAISMEFFAFFALALSALISGFKLSNQTYI